ncbi:MAG: ABC transporter ATP-binding protein [Lachnospiraceae bacterium]|nr:ABC transporter ATP-binding protein [Lachnospiraceae bacterium]
MSLTINQVSKVYGKKVALNQLSLELEDGKIYGLIGRNGAGKTTLLSIASAQNAATDGEVLLDGKKVWENEEALKDICFSREIATTATDSRNTSKVCEYLRIASILYPNWNAELADELINEFGLDRKMRMNKLSKGMQSMVTIIVALASGARFTFLDEPVTGLDVVAREYFYKVLLDEYAKGERTFVISTHIIEEAANVFEEVIFIHEGKVLLKEETDSLLERTVHISGKEEDVDAVCDGKKVHHVEKLGRSKGVTVLLNPGEEPDAKGRDVDIRPLSLQDVFVALCGKEESYE